jgi:hypothetical protein
MDMVRQLMAWKVVYEDIDFIGALTTSIGSSVVCEPIFAGQFVVVGDFADNRIFRGEWPLQIMILAIVETDATAMFALCQLFLGIW